MKATIINTKTVAVNPTEGKLNGNRKPVFCITTGEIYSSAKEAAEKTGMNIASISCACTGKQHTAGKMQFCYVADMTAHILEIATHIQTMRKECKESNLQELRQRAEDAEARAEKAEKRNDKLETILRVVSKAVEI